jgi:hypothetical protein
MCFIEILDKLNIHSVFVQDFISGLDCCMN